MDAVGKVLIVAKGKVDPAQVSHLFFEMNDEQLFLFGELVDYRCGSHLRKLTELMTRDETRNRQERWIVLAVLRLVSDKDETKDQEVGDLMT